MLIKKRSRLILLLGVAQFVCLGWGVMLRSTSYERTIRKAVHQQVLDNNVQIAAQLSNLVREMQLGDIRTDVAEWNRMQKIVRDIRLPNDGFVCLLDSEDGEVICHPNFEERPSLMSREYRVNAPVKESSPDPYGVIVGEGASLEVVAAAELPEISAKIVVHQKGSGIDRAISEIVTPIQSSGWIIALGVTVATTGCFMFILWQYDDRLARINQRLEQRVEQRTRALRKTRDAVIFGLAKLAESRDTDTGEHLERIRTYVTLLAEQLRDDGIEIDPRTVHDIGLASSLHDIGKVGVSDRVLLKPGRLDPDERAEIETHASLGGDCLAAIGERLGEDDFLQLAKEIAYGHHEKYDGTGYPAGITGELIPIAARITALADVYDALRSRRPYKEPMPHERAREIIVEGRGAHFDPIVVEAFLACEERFVEISERSNSSCPRDHAGVPEEEAEAVLV